MRVSTYNLPITLFVYVAFVLFSSIYKRVPRRSSPSPDQFLLFLGTVQNIDSALCALEDRHFIIVFVRTTLAAHTCVHLIISLGCARV